MKKIWKLGISLQVTNERVTQLLAAPSEDKIKYASVSQLEWKSIDGGKSWYNPGNLGLVSGVSYDNQGGMVSYETNFERLEISVSQVI